MKNKSSKKNVKLSRKESRKRQRVDKKARRNEYYSNRNKPGNFVVNPNVKDSVKEQKNKRNEVDKESVMSKKTQVPSTEQQRFKEQNEQRKLQKEMNKRRNQQLKLANNDEDRNIKKLEKQLKLNKRKSKSIPKSFSEDGLGYLLEVCDSEKMKGAVTAEQQFADFNEDFEEDFALITEHPEKSNKRSKKELKSDSPCESIEEDMTDEDDLSEPPDIDSEESADSGPECSENENFMETKIGKKRTNKEPVIIGKPKKLKIEAVVSHGAESGSELDYIEDEDGPEEEERVLPKGASKINADGTWEDIYGRLRAPDGSVKDGTATTKYLPPAIRSKLNKESEGDKKQNEKLSRLRKQLKGLLNRLAESNMHNIATQIEEIYMSNSRNDMNDTLTNLTLESVVANVLTPERLLMEHVLLIIILHANVGTEVGAHFLQVIVKMFDESHATNPLVEDKTLDNLINVLAQLYNFKMFDSNLMYNVLQKLAECFSEKDIDCILHILKSVGFNLRKDDPLALKDLILSLQKKATTMAETSISGSRIKFLLDIILAIKNNNMSKIPNYDTSYSDHLKKIMKSFIRKGNYVTQLNISLQDLLKADERGRWWVVGSAWSGNVSDNIEQVQKPIVEGFSEKMLELARKQRMNTDTRRNIFCIIMSAEDYLDAFEKLLRLGLKNNQDREIVNVILHCCLQEKIYNPYYSILAQKLCDHDRKYQITIKFSVWDKLKCLNEHSGTQIANLSKLLTYLFLEKGLPISTLKIVQFSELDKVSLRFMRQILLGILLHEDLEACQGVFENVAQSEKLKMFRDSLRLFIHHFLLKNLNSASEIIGDKQKTLLETRAKIVEKMLTLKENRTKY